MPTSSRMRLGRRQRVRSPSVLSFQGSQTGRRDPVDLGVEVAEVLARHLAAGYPLGHSLGYPHQLEVRESDIRVEIAEVASRRAGVALRDLGSCRKPGARR